MPFLGAEATWEPSDAEAEAAWVLLVELVTRVSLVDLAADEGTDREALTSLYSLFTTSRELLREHGPGTARDPGDGRLSIAVVIVRLQTNVLRPFLSRWHPRMEEHEAARPDQVGVAAWERVWGGADGALHHAFRSDLRQLREQARDYVYVLGLAARASEFAATVFHDASESERASHRVYASTTAQPRRNVGRVRSRMTRWFDPAEMVPMLYRMLRKQDTRESGPLETLHHDRSAPNELWFDYIADMGDAFDPTAQVAWTAGRNQLKVGPSPKAGEPLPRGSLLILGGDEVYPYASRRRYARQLVKPYQYALEAGNGPAPSVFALPGNHDWYGGLQAWRNILTTPAAPRDFCGWKANQASSWWAIRLPHGWWMWGLDTYLDGTVNEAQKEYFKARADELRPGDQVIICTPVPLWRLREHKPDHLVVIDNLVRELIDPKLAQARVFLAGDSHVFARYTRTTSVSGTKEVHVTSGGGGAFLQPTHNLAAAVPQTAIVDGAFVDPAPFLEGRFWPDKHRSRDQIARGAYQAAVDRQSPLLALVVAAIYTLYGLAAGADVRSNAPAGGWSGLRLALRSTVSSPWGWWATALVAVLLVWLGVAVARPNTKERAVVRFARRAGVGHGMVQFGVLFSTATVAHWLLGWWTGRRWGPAILPAALGGFMGGLATVVVLTVYLSRVNRNHRVNDNEAFSGRHFTDAKHFLRCHIGPTGTLTVRLIGIDTIQPEWAAAIEAGDTLPPKAPEGPNLVGMVEWTETVRRQVDPIPFVRDANRWVALSVSDPAGSTADEVAERHLLVEAIAEALLDAGCNIAYGGDNRLGGYDRTLAGAAARTADLRLARVRRYVRAASPSARTAPGVETVRVPAPVGALDDEYADRRWLTAMRELVSDQCFARVVVGGRASGTSLPGVIEEGAISFGRGQALLVVGGSGGAASALAAAIRGAVMPHDIGVASIAALGALQPTDGQPVDLHNGLTPEENQELLTTKELHRIVYLVVQGMRVTAIGGRPSSGTA